MGIWQSPLGLSVWFDFCSHQWVCSQCKYTLSWNFVGWYYQYQKCRNIRSISSVTLKDVVWSANMVRKFGGFSYSAYACWCTVKCPKIRRHSNIRVWDLWLGFLSRLPIFQYFHSFFFQNFHRAFHLWNIFYVFNKCRHSQAVVTPVKYECDLKNIIFKTQNLLNRIMNELYWEI